MKRQAISRRPAPDILAKPEVARAMEQASVEAMVWCLASGDPVDVRSVHRHHATVMRRLEEVLQANAEQPLYMAELSAAARVSYRTLRASCQEHLGMSPKRYLGCGGCTWRGGRCERRVRRGRL